MFKFELFFVLLPLMALSVKLSRAVNLKDGGDWNLYKKKYSKTFFYFFTEFKPFLKLNINFILDLTFSSKIEETTRWQSFQQSLHFIKEHNGNANTSFTLRINKNSHYSTREFGELFFY